MVDLTLKEKGKTDVLERTSNSEKYPYGLKLSFQSEQIKKLPLLNSSQVGDKIIIHAECCIVEKRIDEKKDNETRENVELQVEKVAVMPKINKKPGEMNPREYRNMREGNE